MDASQRWILFRVGHDLKGEYVAAVLSTIATFATWYCHLVSEECIAAIA